MVSHRCSWQLDGDALMSSAFFKQQQQLLTTVDRKGTRLAAETSTSEVAAQKLTDGCKVKTARATALPKRSAVYMCVYTIKYYNHMVFKKSREIDWLSSFECSSRRDLTRGFCFFLGDDFYCLVRRGRGRSPGYKTP